MAVGAVGAVRGARELPEEEHGAQREGEPEERGRACGDGRAAREDDAEELVLRGRARPLELTDEGLGLRGEGR